MGLLGLSPHIIESQDYNDLNGAVSDGQDRIVIIKDTITLTADVTVSDCTILVVQGGLIQLGNYDLTFSSNSHFICPPNYQAFSYTGTGAVSFTNSPIAEVSAGWFEDLNKANAAASSKTLVVSSSITLVGNVTISFTTKLKIESNGYIDLGNYNLIINSRFECLPNYQAFIYSGTGEVDFTGAEMSEIHASWFPTFTDAVTGSLSKTLIVSDTQYLTANVTLANCTLIIQRSGNIKLGNYTLTGAATSTIICYGTIEKTGTGTLTVSGRLEAPDNHWVFVGFSAGDITLGARARYYVTPQMFGVQLGGADDTVALGVAIRTAYDASIWLQYISTVTITSTITIPAQKKILWRSQGYHTAVVKNTGSGAVFVIGDSTTDTNYIHIEGINFQRTDTTADALDLSRVHRSHFIDVKFDTVRYGFRLRGCLLNTFIKCGGSTTGDTLFYHENASSTFCNGNTYIGTIAELGTGNGNGWYFANHNGQGNNTIIGGTCEGAAGYAIYAENVIGLKVIGLHVETMTSGIKLIDSSQCLINCSYNDAPINLENCLDIKIEGSAKKVNLDETTKFCKIDYRFGSGGEINWYDESNIIRATRIGQEYLLYGMKKKGVLISPNGDLEKWTGSPLLPSPFTNAGSATITRTGDGQSDTTRKSRLYAAKVTNSGGGEQGLQFSVPAIYKGQWISVGCWALFVAGTPEIIWGSQTRTIPIGVTSTTVWRRLEFSWYFDPAISDMNIMFGGNTDADSAYWDSIEIWAEHEAAAPSRNLPTGTTPSVGDWGAMHHVYKTNNSSSTTITDFLNGYPGQRITIIAGDTYTTIAHGTNIKLRGAASKGPLAGDDVIELVYDGAKWRQSSYESVNS